MAEASQKKELRDFFKKLSEYEDSVRKYILGESSSLGFSNSFLDSITGDALKAELMSVKSGNGSFAEAYTLDVVFRIDSLQRDLLVRKRRRRDYYDIAAADYESESIRLNASGINSIQTYSGNTKIQRGGS